MATAHGKRGCTLQDRGVFSFVEVGCVLCPRPRVTGIGAEVDTTRGSVNSLSGTLGASVARVGGGLTRSEFKSYMALLRFDSVRTSGGTLSRVSRSVRCCGSNVSSTVYANSVITGDGKSVSS